MNVQLITSAHEFLDRSREFRSREPFLTNVIASTATSIAEGHRSYESVAFWSVEDVGRVVQGVMMRTAPHRLVVSSMPLGVVSDAAAAVRAHDPYVPGLSGPRTVARALVDAFVAQRDARLVATIERGTLVYVLGELRPAMKVPGVARAAVKTDFELLRRWWIGFGDDTGIEMHGFEDSLRVAIGEGRIFVWCQGELPVCAVAHSPVVATPAGTVARIGPVYTPPEERRRGFAGVLTSFVTARLVDRGSRVMLFTDAANPTSNGVYTRLGFEKIADVDEYSFTHE